jgi:hypothetical protein
LAENADLDQTVRIPSDEECSSETRYVYSPLAAKMNDCVTPGGLLATEITKFSSARRLTIVVALYPLTSSFHLFNRRLSTETSTKTEGRRVVPNLFRGGRESGAGGAATTTSGPPKLGYRSMVSVDDVPELFASIDSKLSRETLVPLCLLLSTSSFFFVGYSSDHKSPYWIILCNSLGHFL